MCGQIQVGYLEVELKDHTVHKFGRKPTQNASQFTDRFPPAESLVARLTIIDDNFFARIVKSADLGFAEAFMAGEVRVDDLTTFLKILIFNRDYMGNLDTRLAFLGHLFDKISHWRVQMSILRKACRIFVSLKY